MTAMPLVSICVPTFNSAPYLREALDSLLAQSYPNCEIVVSDNASSDGTVEILREYAGTGKIRLLLNDVNVGAGGNFNRLVESAAGEFVAIYHADDRYEPTIVAESMALFMENATVGLVGTMATAMDETGKYLFTYSLPEGTVANSAGLFDFDSAMTAVLNTRRQKIFFVTPSIMVRREVYLRVGLFDQKTWSSTVDYEMWLRIAREHDLAVIARPLMHYRIHAAQGSELEVRKNAELPDSLAVISAYRHHIRSAAVGRLCRLAVDRTRIKTALKQNALGQFAKSSSTVESLETIRYRLCAMVIRTVNRLKLNLRIWP